MKCNTCVEQFQLQLVALLEPGNALWTVGDDTPIVRQIYGHFLAPRLMKAVKSGLVAKDFNFPSAYHAATDRSLETVLAEIESLEPATTVCIVEGVRIREEDEGAVVYTPHFNGYYLNHLGREVLGFAAEATALSSLAECTSLDIDEIKDFIADLMVLGIVNVDYS